MARNRIVKPEFWDDEKFCRNTSREARLTFIGLLTNSDDYGVVKGHPGWLKSHIFPYDEDLSREVFESWLANLEKIKVIVPFFDNGERYYFIVHFLKHQTIDKPSKTRNPEPPLDSIRIVLDEYSESTRRALDYEVEVEVEEKKKINTPPLPPPTGRGGGEDPSVGKMGGKPKNLAGNSTPEKTELIGDGKTTQPGKNQKQARRTAIGRNSTLPKSLQFLFERFWKAWPRKQNRAKAEKAFAVIAPDEQLLATMLATIERAKKSRQWLKDNGEYIPHPASWLNARGWEDEYPQDSPQPAKKPHRDPCYHDEGRPIPLTSQQQQEEAARRKLMWEYEQYQQRTTKEILAKMSSDERSERIKQLGQKNASTLRRMILDEKHLSETLAAWLECEVMQELPSFDEWRKNHREADMLEA